LVVYRAVLDLPDALVGWVAMLIVARGGGRRCKLRPWRRAVVALVCLRGHVSLAEIAAGFGMSESTARAYTSAVIALLAERTPGLLKVLREADPELVLLDGTLTECDRVGDGRADCSAKHRRHGVDVQVVTDPDGRLLVDLARAAGGEPTISPRPAPTASSAHANAGGCPSWPTSPTRAPAPG
jgi:hypothetical protein